MALELAAVVDAGALPNKPGADGAGVDELPPAVDAGALLKLPKGLGVPLLAASDGPSFLNNVLGWSLVVDVGVWLLLGWELAVFCPSANGVEEPPDG